MGWDKVKICETLRGLHRQGTPIYSRRLRQTHSSLFAAAVHWFGSYAAAVKGAGIPYEQVRRMQHGRWNRATVARELRRLHHAGEAIHHAALERTRPELVVATYRYFGSYARAVEAAGLSYAKVRVREMPSWNKARIVTEFKQLKREKQGLWKRAVRRSSPYLERAAVRCFGSYERAAKVGGIDAKELRPPTYRFWSPDRIVTDLKALHRRSPRLLKPSRLQERRPNLLRACRRQFRSYRQALETAGIAYERVARTTLPPLPRERVLSMLSDLFERGKDVRYSYLYRANPRLVDAARQQFGSYRDALRAAGLSYPPPPPLRHWTAGLVLKTLKTLEKKGTDLRYRYFRSSHLPLFEAARFYFGTYLNAVREAKIDYDAVVRTQLRRQLPRRKS